MSDQVDHDWKSAGAERRGHRTIVTSMDLAIYCHMQHLQGRCDLPVVSVTYVSRGRHEIVFEDPRDVVSKLESEFANDRVAAGFAAAQRSLKSILRERCERGYERCKETSGNARSYQGRTVQR